MGTELNKILVVLHQPEIREQIKSELERKGYRISISTNGLEGMFAGYCEKFVLIISSMELPKVTGFEMMRALHNRSYNQATPAIFIATGEESDEAIQLASKLNVIFMPLSAITSSINKVDESTQIDDQLNSVKIGSS